MKLPIKNEYLIVSRGKRDDALKSLQIVVYLIFIAVNIFCVTKCYEPSFNLNIFSWLEAIIMLHYILIISFTHHIDGWKTPSYHPRVPTL